jgi:dTDP-4-dehydrorhamnose reductase
VRVVVIGANGQLGSDLVKALPPHEVVPLTHADLEVVDGDAARAVLARQQPQVVVNTAAFHKVEACEREPLRAYEVNALGVRNVALACRELGCALVQMSTDYVFDGAKRTPYLESDTARPINAYGVSKLAGEHFLRYLWEKHYLVRASGLFGEAGSSGKGGNFVETMLRAGREKGQATVVADLVFSPTYTADLAQVIARLIETERYGVYHVTNAGECSWHDFAAEIFRQVKLTVALMPTTACEMSRDVARPAYSVLGHEALKAAGLEPMRPWQEALADYLKQKKYVH